MRSAHPRARGPLRALAASSRSADSYGLLLALLIIAYIAYSVSPGPANRLTFTVVGVATLLLALHTSRAPRRYRNAARVAAGFSLVVAAVDASSIDTGRIAATAAAITAMLLLIGAPIAIMARILRHREVSIETILGALCVYILIGFIFAVGYATIDVASGEFFAFQSDPASSAELLYYSFTVLTTLGFGDLTAAGNLGRSLSVIEAMMGQIFLITLVARLVGLFGQPSRRPEPREGAGHE